MKQFSHDNKGASALEYGIIAALIAVAIMVAVNSVGYQTILRFHDVIACIDDIPGPCPPGPPPPP
ncbi:MAG: Flp family type IVb pilin [Proteobacteria bacterium]|nr:Flp family type IVb pilin [Pseudomonadota bacterium]